jgi:membrane protein DedA with SNARE-associated domain
MMHWIGTLVGSLGYWGIGLLMAIENIVLPLPSELIMSLGGFLSARGRMEFWVVVLVGAFGSVVGAFPMYGIARFIGKERIATWVDHRGKWLLLRGRDLERASRRFERHGGWAVFFSQLVPGIRGLISLPAGFAKMNLLLFTLANFAGTVIWCAVLAYLGFALGVHYQRVHAYVGPAVWIALGGLAVWGVVRYMRRRSSRRQS